MNTETAEATRTLSTARVFWGHQSVGGNVIAGLMELLKESKTQWSIVEVGQAGLPSGPAFLHRRIGENGDPKGKMDDFARSLQEIAEPKPRLAFMKLCYVDVKQDTDVQSLLGYYQMVISKLKVEHPNTVFGHVTVPLAPESNSIKDRIKRLAGVELKRERDNLRRTQYNDLLRRTFPTDPMFDLERVESTRQDGTRVHFAMDGQNGYSLVKEYAGDASGHLNPLGQELAAMELLRFMTAAIAH